MGTLLPTRVTIVSLHSPRRARNQQVRLLQLACACLSRSRLGTPCFVRLHLHQQNMWLTKKVAGATQGIWNTWLRRHARPSADQLKAPRSFVYRSMSTRNRFTMKTIDFNK